MMNYGGKKIKKEICIGEFYEIYVGLLCGALCIFHYFDSTNQFAKENVSRRIPLFFFLNHS